MPAPNLTPAGLTIQTFSEVLAQIASDVRGALGQQMQADNPIAVIGIVDAIVARFAAAVQEAIQGVYLSKTLDGAWYIDLDKLLQLAGLYRKAATQSRVTLHMVNASGAGATIPAGALIQIDNTLYQFVIPAAFGILAGGDADVSVLAVATGPTPVTAGQTWQWVSSFAGSTSITTTNPADGVAGDGVETDPAFKLRFVQSFALPGAGTLESIRANVLAILAVQEVAAFENDSDVAGIVDPVTVPGLPPHSFVVAVKGTQADSGVGAVVFARKPCGIRSFGDTAVVVTDSQGYARTVRYQKAVSSPIYVTVHVYGPAGLAAVDLRTPILRYVNGGAATTTQPAATGLRVAQAALFNRLYSLASDACDATGFDATNIILTLGSSPSPVGTANITPAWDHYCTLADIHLITAVN
jgi:hypothetical protein